MGKSVRVTGLSKAHPHYRWLQESMLAEKPNLDYFSYADEVKKDMRTTNSLYSDLLRTLTTQRQTKKLFTIASEAAQEFKKRNTDPTSDFANSFKEYWEQRSKINNTSSSSSTIVDQQQKTLNNINNMALASFETFAARTYSSLLPTYHEPNEVMTSSKLLSSDRVAHINIIDLSCKATTEMLEQTLGPQNFSNINLASTLSPYRLSQFGEEIVEAFSHTNPSKNALKQTLIQYGPQMEHDNIEHADRAFIEVTGRHFMDLIESNRNPLMFPLKEISACIDTTGFILNKLFISHNDLIKLNWIENQHYTTSTRKWDGLLIKVDDSVVAIGLIELSGGVSYNSTETKEKDDITKLYKNMKTMIVNLPDTVPKKVFCVRFFDSSIFFEELFMLEGNFYRIIHVTLVCPTTPQLLKDYVKNAPKLFAWKHAVINQTLKF